jgi:hypothetical protein
MLLNAVERTLMAGRAANCPFRIQGWLLTEARRILEEAVSGGVRSMPSPRVRKGPGWPMTPTVASLWGCCQTLRQSHQQTEGDERAWTSISSS